MSNVQILELLRFPNGAVFYTESETKIRRSTIIDRNYLTETRLRFKRYALKSENIVNENVQSLPRFGAVLLFQTHGSPSVFQGQLRVPYHEEMYRYVYVSLYINI